jgi:DNA-binding HxlR family transcriptional regulator
MPCAIARSMAVLGERWTLVILRSAFMGARRFEDYQSSTGIARNILTDRLKTLVDHDVLARRPYAEHPGRTLYEYRLTEKGLDLYPVLVSLMQWGNRYGGFDTGPPVELEHKLCGHATTPKLVCSQCGEELHAREVVAHEMAPAG